VKPNPLPKITQQQSLNLVFSQSVSSTNAAEALRLQLDTDNGVIFAIDPDGQVSLIKVKSVFGKVKLLNKNLLLV
jgi:outer membrane protein assembly factor BamB